MSGFIVYQDSYIGATIVSNRFIDEYMTDANDAQLKVYLYLVRMLNAHLETSVSDIADRFNHTEKDVLRAFSYWEKKGLLTLDRDDAGEVCGIHLVNLCRSDAPGPTVEETHKKVRMSVKSVQSSANVGISTVEGITPSAENSADAETSGDAGISTDVSTSGNTGTPDSTGISSNADITGYNQSAAAPEAAGVCIAEKPEYSASELKEFGKKQGCMIISLAETYFGRPLSRGDMQSLCYMMDGLGMKEELIDYLLQYCADKGKKDFRYAEKVAIGWKEKNITTVEEASGSALKYDRSVYSIMNRLGKSSSPTDKEMEFISRWTATYGFGEEVILEACDRTVLATDTHRFQYAEGILGNWYKNNIRSREDIASYDEKYQKKLSSDKNVLSGNSGAKDRFSGSAGAGNGGTAARISGAKSGSGSFGKFQQNDVDYAAVISRKYVN